MNGHTSTGQTFPDNSPTVKQSAAQKVKVKNGSKCFWIKKQIKPFHVYVSLLSYEFTSMCLVYKNHSYKSSESGSIQTMTSGKDKRSKVKQKTVVTAFLFHIQLQQFPI